MHLQPQCWRRQPSPPAAFSASPVLAQEMPRLAGPPDQSENQGEDRDQSVGTLKVNVNVVQLFFNVKDKKGGLIPNLNKGDFQILEDGKPQTIKYFTAESDLPLTLGILIDSSGSQQRVLDMEKEVGGELPERDSALQGRSLRHQLRRRFQPVAGFHQLAAAAQGMRLTAPASMLRPPPAAAFPEREVDRCPAVRLQKAQCFMTRFIWLPMMN